MAVIMLSLGDMWVWQLVLAVGFGIGSAVVPFMNAEAYVLVFGATNTLNLVIAAIGVTIGQTIGKVAMFFAVWYRPGYAVHKHKELKVFNLDIWWGRLWQRNRDLSKRLLDAMSDSRWGFLVMLLSAFVGVPSLYGVALIGGASRMRTVVFIVFVLVGRGARFILLAFGVSMF